MGKNPMSIMPTNVPNIVGMMRLGAGRERLFLRAIAVATHPIKLPSTRAMKKLARELVKSLGKTVFNRKSKLMKSMFKRSTAMPYHPSKREYLILDSKRSLFLPPLAPEGQASQKLPLTL